MGGGAKTGSNVTEGPKLPHIAIYRLEDAHTTYGHSSTAIHLQYVVAVTQVTCFVFHMSTF